MNKETIRVAVNIFVIKDESILMGKRKGKVGDGFWCIPGGHLEYGESLIEGAKRELKEETNLNAELFFLNVVNDYLREDETHYIHFQFLAKDVVGEPKINEPNKCYEWRWFSIDKLPENIFIGHRKVISTFLKKETFSDN